MPQNPFISRADWKKDKEKYGIPDKVLSFSFGEKMEDLNKKFDKAGLKGPLTMTKVPAAMQLVKEGNKLRDDYIKALGKLKPEKIKDKNGALSRLALYKTYIQGLANAAEGTRDPFAGPRHNYDKCLAQMKNAIAHPDDPKALQDLYSQGMRNHLGATFHAALTSYKGEKEVMDLLQKYEQLVGGWHGPMQGEGASVVAKDPVKRKKLLEDMQDAMKLGVRILGLTKPK